ncbi:hypothetical protein KY290_031970 [Solanum tuberosum]|uniref:DUF4216 domain-containing protein n=1 Tax=Solanum tuberosum TaxID=4113 RepID=A0ABQ7UAT1_SOLTU|nr:hypothetical protein KY290_031970 [Solanum tuberosum]
MNLDISSTVSDDLKFLANGPAPHARRFTIFNINGIKFRTTSREHELKTQNNGVFLTSSTTCIASSSDGNLRLADLPYYEKLEDIIELNYYVNFSQLIHIGDREEHDPFIEASQAQMVYYVEDELDKGWNTVVHFKPRDFYDMGEGENEVLEIEFPVQDLDQFFEMPKQNQYKNMFKSAASSSLAPGHQHVPSSSSDGDSSQSVVPSTFDGVSSKPTKRKDNEDNHDWFVDVIDQHQVTKMVRMKIRDVHNMEKGLRIIVECDEYVVPIGKVAGIIAGVMG